MQDTYENCKSRCYLNDLPPEQFFNDNRIALIATRNVVIDNKQYNAVQTSYNTNVISYVNLSSYRFIYSIRQVDTIVGNYNVFNIVVTGIKHADMNNNDTMSMNDMSSMCLDKSDELAKVMQKFLK